MKLYYTPIRSSGGKFQWNFMKTSFYLTVRAILFCLVANLCYAQTVQSSTNVSAQTYSVIKRDADSRVWEWTENEQAPNGQTIPRKHHYTELAAGLCYQQNGQWLDSQEQINILPDGSAAAIQGQHQVNLPGDIYNGVITLVTPDGLQLKSQPIGLSYDNGTNIVLIAELTNSVGQLISSNQVIYTNAFLGIDADLLYTYRKAGFEQDVIFRKQPPAPEQFGLNSADTRLQMLTEFINPPTPIEAVTPINQNDGLQDTTLTFGAMTMKAGKAFLIGNAGHQGNLNQAHVYKSWVVVNGRTLLVEELPYRRISPQLSILPSSSAVSLAPAKSVLYSVSSKRMLPPVRIVKKVPLGRLAKAINVNRPGVVLDYMALDSNKTNFTFQGDTTYYISGPCLLSGTNGVEGGTTIKFANGGYLEIATTSEIDFDTAPYRPAVFTSQNDDSIGEVIWNISSGTPNFTDETVPFITIDGTNAYFHDLRFSYTWQAISEENFDSTNYFTVRDCQFFNVVVPVYAYQIYLYNDLIGYSSNEVYGSSGIIAQGDPEIWLIGPGGGLLAEHVTSDLGYGFIDADATNQVIALTNCLVTSQILTNIDKGATLLTNAVVYMPSPTGTVYQVVGGGNYYLTNGSPYRQRGTANIDPDLYVELAEKTTYPPRVYSGTNLSSLGTLGQFAARDTNTLPDIGYHYDPVDYALGGCVLSSSLTFASGTAVAWFEASGTTYVQGQPYGISLNDGANLIFNGSATAPCVFTRSELAQEGGDGIWGNTGWNLGMVFMGSSQEATISANFTKWTSTYFINILQDRGSKGQGFFKNCEFYNNFITTWNVQNLYYTNCLFYRPGIALMNSPNLILENCTCYNGGVTMDRSSAVHWLVENCSFDGTGFNGSDSYGGSPTYTTIDHNAYNTNNLSWKAYTLNGSYNGKLEVSGSSDVMVTNYNWESSWFGNFYLPASSLLLTNGSTNANCLGLYHFTTQTNQSYEGTNIVDIGYHYVATDTNGIPLDSNGDGIPDYLEDPLGNGLPYNGTNWALAILIQPTNQTVFTGAYVTTSVTAGGVAPLAYRWYFNSNLIANATSSNLVLPDIQTNSTGYFFAIVTNNFGAVTSSIVKLTVVPLDALFDVDFGGTSASTKTGYAAVGDSGSDFWNEYGQTNVSSGSLPNLLTAEGQVSQVGLLVTNLPACEFNGSSDPMYNDYLSAPIDQVATLTITNLPTGNWDIYFYSDDSTFDLIAGTNYCGFQTCYDQPLSGLLWQPGVQYVVFENISVSNQELVTIDVYPGTNLTALISGLQIAFATHNPGGFGGSVVLDSDYDGVSDYHELEERTDPNNPNSVLPIELGSWSFDNTSTWIGDQGQLPLTATNIVGVLSWSTNAVQIDTNKSAILCYRDVETNGDANINLRSGTVRFWFRPDWSSADQGGVGPGSQGRLIEMGNYNPAFTNGWWAMFLSQDGTQLSFGCSTNGHGITNLSTSVSWTSNIWHQLVLTYTPTNSLFYFDGQLVTNGVGAIYYPNVTERAQGFRIGSDTNGTNQARGAFDLLETFNYPLSASDISSNFQAAITQDSDGDGLPDIWEMDYFGHLGNDPNADPNGDGMDNAQDAAAGLNPLIPEQVLLGHWRFDNAPSWQDDQGLAPYIAQNLFPIPDWSGDAVEINSQSGSVLGYPGLRTNGAPVLTGPAGTISFWFKPDWNGATATNWAGGPGTFARLFEIGRETSDASYGWFGLTTDPLGTELNFATEAGGVHTNVLVGLVPFNSHTWYQIVLTYSPTQSDLYVNGQLAASGSGLTCAPSASVVQKGFYFGSSWDGTGQANGRFDELETYNFPLTATNIVASYAAAMNILAVDGLPVIEKDGWSLRSDAVDSDCDGVPDAWKITNGFNPTLPATQQEFDDYTKTGSTNGVMLSITNVMDEGTFSFGSFPAGSYRVDYVTGAWICSTLSYPVPPAWCVDQVDPEIIPPTHAITVLYNDGEGQDAGQAVLNGSLFSDYTNETDAEAGASGSYTTFTHSGGDISLQFIDDPYYDNRNGVPPPIYLLYLYTIHARPGIDAVYLFWPPFKASATYEVLRSIGSTNSFTTIGSTTNLYYTDINLTAGTTNYYQVQWVDGSRTTNSPIVSAVPFDCPEPLPPRIDYVNPLQLTANNSTYEVPYSVLLTNSDAFDPQGYPLVFEVDSVGSGSLMINGAPFSANNCTINTNTSVIWTPPSAMMATNNPAFRVYVFDGLNRSTNVVNVFIKQQPQTHLFGWGNILWGTIGNGIAQNMTDFEGCDPWDTQAGYFAAPRDPRWQYYDDQCHVTGSGDPGVMWINVPQQVLDIDKIVSLSQNISGVDWSPNNINAVTADGHLYSWGEGLGINWGNYYLQSLSAEDQLISTQWDGTANDDAGWSEIYLSIPSPREYQGALSNLVSVCSHNNDTYVLKNDGTVWSWGPAGSDPLNLGRTPQSPGDLFYNVGTSTGMTPGQIPINDKIVELHADDPGGSSVIARGQDGQVFWWGEIDNSDGKFWLAGNDDPGNSDDYHNPNPITTLSIPGAAPIVQISVNSQHYLFLRQDGTVSELGYIPSQDANSTWSDEGFMPSETDASSFYQNTPVAVSGLPSNIIQVSAALSFAAAVTADGNVWVWGHTLDTDSVAPRQVTSLKNIIKIVAGNANCILALDKYGILWGWGFDEVDLPLFGLDPEDGENPVLDDGGFYEGNFYTQAVQIPGLNNVQDVFLLSPSPLDGAGYPYNVAFVVDSSQQEQNRLTASPLDQAVQLTWTNYSGASYYIVYRSLNEGAGYVAIGRTPNTTFIDGNPLLQNGQTYYYEVSAVVNGVEAETSSPASATPMPPPAVVQNFTVTGECRDVLLTWNAPTDPTAGSPQEYRIERAETSGGPFIIIGYCQAGTTAYEDSSGIDGQTYYYHVISINSAGNATSATESGAIDSSSCILCPNITTNWMPNSGNWFNVIPIPNSTEATNTLYWTGPTDGDWLYTTNDDVGDFQNGSGGLIQSVMNGATSSNPDPLFSNIWNKFSHEGTNILGGNTGASLDQLIRTFIDELNTNVLQGPSLYSFFVANGYPISKRTSDFEQQLEGITPTLEETTKLNRMLLDDGLDRLGFGYVHVMSGPSWGTNIQFSIESHYMLPDGSVMQLPAQIISVSQATQNPEFKAWNANQSYLCYKYSWEVPQGVQCWASVSIVTNGQQGASSIEVGPLAASPDPDPWSVTPNAVPGYHQVYLDWPSDITIFQYEVDCSAIVPGIGELNPPNNPFSGNPSAWVVLATNLLDPRYWHMDLTSTNFTPVDFKYVGDFLLRLTSASSSDPVSTIIWNKLSNSEQTALINYSEDGDIMDARTNLATNLTSLVQGGTLLFNPYDPSGAAMQAPDLSTATKSLLAKYTNGIANAIDLATLNRLLLEDVYVHDIARYETPTNGEFISEDFAGISGLIQYGLLRYDSDPVASILWNDMSPAFQSEVLDYNSGTGPDSLTMQRDLTVALNNILQTNLVLFTTNDVIADIESGFGGVSPRTLQLYNQHTTNEIPLLNRLLLQDAWWHVYMFNGGFEPLSDLRYYWVTATFCDLASASSYWVGARPSDKAAPPPSVTFSAQATPMNGMVLVQWNNPGGAQNNSGAWQFSLARNGNDGTPYMTILDTTFGLSYLDSEVTNGLPYKYQVTAFDTNYDQYVAVTTSAATPTNSSDFALLPPQAGSGYVDLAWTPVPVKEYNVMRSTSPSGPFSIISSILPQYEPLNEQNTYQDIGVQNGLTYYYQIQAVTLTGFLLDSQIQSATPSSSLAPLPPDKFQGQYIPDDANGRIELTWNSQNGAQTYQLFLVDQSRLTPLTGYNGVNTSFTYEIPWNVSPYNTYTFAVRSVNSQGIAGDITETTIQNQPPSSGATSNAPVVLQVGGSLTDLTVTGPTNLALIANVNIPYVKQVDFYSDDGDGLGPELIGTAGYPSYQTTWYHVPSGIHTVTAVAYAVSSSLYGSGASFTSTPIDVTVNIQSLLSAYQTSVTDLQLPAPAWPISLSRLYNSRITSTNGPLGVGWSPSWTESSLTLTTNFDTGWIATTQAVGNNVFYYINQSMAHCEVVTLPNGQSVSFNPELFYPTDSPPATEESIDITNQALLVNEGFLTNSDENLVVAAGTGRANNVPIAIDPYAPTTWKYIGPDGTQYQFGQNVGNNRQWLLTKITDLSGNSLNYVYDSNNNLLSLSNSCGRAVNFSYVSTAAGTNIEVFDAIGGAYPSLIYQVSNNCLVQVRQLLDRTVGVYLTNSYAYGNNHSADPQDFNRLTQIYDGRGVEVLQNAYTNDVGDLAMQISPGETNIFSVDTNYNNDVIETSISSTATNTTEVQNDDSGAIFGATLPANGTSPSGTLTTQNGYDDNGLLTSQADANGNSKNYYYDSQNRLVGQSDQDGDTTSMEPNQYGKPNTSTDANGNQTLYEYDSADNPISTMDPSQTITTYTYSRPLQDAHGNALVGELQTSESENAPDVPYTIITTNVYDLNPSDPIKGDLLQTTEEWVDSGGNVQGTPVTTSYTYDSNGNQATVVKTRNVNGGTQTITTANTYDGQNRVILTVVIATGSQILAPQTNTITYNKLGKQATTTDAAGRTTTNVYDFNGNLIETEYPDGTVSRAYYNGFSQQMYVQDRAVPDGSGTTTAPATYNVYDASGRVIQTGRSDGVQLTKLGAVLGTDFSGAPNETEYKLVVANAGTILTTNLTFYDAVGNVQYSVSDRGAVTQNQYDSAGNLTNTLVYTTYTFTLNGTNLPAPIGSSQSTSYTYDSNGNQIAQTDAKGNTTISVYDEADQLVEVDEPSAGGGTFSKFTYYDGLGRKIESDDEAGVATTYTYDFRGLLTSVTLGAGTPQVATAAYQYDEAGNEVAQTDAAGRTTAFQYDALGHRIERTLPGGQSEGFAYDLKGNQIYHTNFNGVVITNQYDVDNRLTNCSAKGYNIAYAYSATGLRTNMIDASGVTMFFYNALSELTNKTEAWNAGPTISLNYKYDAACAITNIYSSTANGVNLIYNYDILGRITNVLANGSSIANYGYDIVGNLQAMQYGNGVANLYQYDPMNRLTNLVWNLGNSPLASFVYTLAPAGNRRSLLETVNGTGRFYGWNYDPLYRLTNETMHGATEGNLNYAYDSVGNRTNLTSSVAELNNQSPIYNASDWMTNSDGYDNDGNTTNSTGNTYVYDVLDRLTNVNSGQIVITSDGDGNRVSKKVNGTNFYYLVDDENPSGCAQVLEEWTSTGTPALSKVYNYGNSLISQRQPNLSTNYIITDGHDSTRMLMDATGKIANALVYDAFGNLIASNGVLQTAYLYSGQQYDSNLGFYYNRARYLNTGTGRFWTMDTQPGNNEEPLSLHKYFYAADDPVNNCDLSGHDYYADQWKGMAALLSKFGPSADATTEVGLGVFAAQYQVLVVTLPNGRQYLPKTKVKNSSQAIVAHAVYGTLIYIAVPTDVKPQEIVDSWSGTIFNNNVGFFWYWRPGGPNDYKLPIHEGPNASIYDSFGNFEFGASGYAAGFDCSTLILAGQVAHATQEFHNSPTNERDITAGWKAILHGGKLSVENKSLVP